MHTHRKILRFGVAVILCATLLRVAGNVLPEDAVSKENFMAFLILLQTGKWVDPSQVTEPTAPEIPTLPQVQEVMVREPSPQPMVLTQADAQAVAVSNSSGYEIDTASLLQQPLQWNLRIREPTVLILHTHGTESYTKTEDYEEDSAYRTLDENYNVISIGDQLAACLEEAGIGVIHDRTAYDYPSYNGSYNQARKALEQHLQENPSLCLIVDVHRDAMTDSGGNQIGYTVETQTGTAAKLMLVAGTDAGGLNHPRWKENLSMIVKLQVALEKQCSGLCRPISLRTGRFNQDLFPNMVLVEVGAAGNTRQEALLAAQLLAQGIAQLSEGTTYE